MLEGQYLASSLIAFSVTQCRLGRSSLKSETFRKLWKSFTHSRISGIACTKFTDYEVGGI